MTSTISIAQKVQLRTYEGSCEQHYERWNDYLKQQGVYALSRHPAWLSILQKSLGHEPYCLEIVEDETTIGWLPLLSVRSWLFGRFLVSLPYLNSGGVVANDDNIARQLIQGAVELADKLDVKYLELRHEKVYLPDAFTDQLDHKVHMRLQLSKSAGALWDSFKPKVRNQVRKPTKNNLTAHWGGLELLPEFYAVFSQNMRDLGTPVYSRKLFQETLATFNNQAELGIVRNENNQALAAGLILHGEGVTEIPSASSLREHNKTCANMLLYWTALERAIEHGQSVFDFGRSTPGSSTWKFKKQWGAVEHPAHWQYYRRHGTVSDARPDNPKYQKLIKLWQKLPVSLANVIGPFVVRGIP